MNAPRCPGCGATREECDIYRDLGHACEVIRSLDADPMPSPEEALEALQKLVALAREHGVVEEVYA